MICNFMTIEYHFFTQKLTVDLVFDKHDDHDDVTIGYIYEAQHISTSRHPATAIMLNVGRCPQCDVKEDADCLPPIKERF